MRTGSHPLTYVGLFTLHAVYFTMVLSCSRSIYLSISPYLSHTHTHTLSLSLLRLVLSDREDDLTLARMSTHSMHSHDDAVDDELDGLVRDVCVLETHTDDSIQKQGYLWKRSTNVRKDWKRRWFILREGMCAICGYHSRL